MIQYIYVTTSGIKETATHQFELHDAHTVSKDVSGRPQQLGEGIQSVVFEGRTSNLEREQQKMDQWNNYMTADMCSYEWP